MGRKSKAKKLIREALKEDKQKKKKNPKSKKVEKKIHFPFKIIVALMFFMFFSATTFFLITNSFKSQDIANYFSEKDTILTLEFNSDFENLKTLTALKTLSIQDIKASIEQIFLSDYEKNIAPWLGKNAGFVVIRDEKLAPQLIFFAETKSRKKAFEIFAIEETQRQIIPLADFYFPKNPVFEKPKFMTIVDSYMFFANENAILADFLKMQSEKKLSQSEEYLRAKQNLTDKNISFLFVNNKNISSTDLSLLENLTGIQIPKEFVLTLFKYYVSEGISIFEKNGNFVLEAFTNLKNPIKAPNQNISFTPTLHQFIPENTFFFFQSKSPATDLIEIEQISGQSLSSSIELSIAKRIFSSISFDEDIKPLLNYESLIFIDDENSLGLLLKNTDEKANEKFSNLIFLFAQSRAGFDKDIVEQTLPDGSKYKEYIRVPKQIEKNTDIYRGIPYYFYPDFYYAFTNEALIFAQNPETLKKILDKILDKSIAQNFTISSNNLIYLSLKKTLPFSFIPFTDITIENTVKDLGILSSTILKLK